MEPVLRPSASSTIIVFDGGSSFNHLIHRYAEQIGHSVTVAPLSVLVETVCNFKPIAVIFPSVDGLEESQSLVAQLANCDIPIIVCSSITDENHTRELGADYCLLHPLVFDNFSAILGMVISRGKHQMDVTQLCPDQPTSVDQV